MPQEVPALPTAPLPHSEPYPQNNHSDASSEDKLTKVADQVRDDVQHMTSTVTNHTTDTVAGWVPGLESYPATSAAPSPLAGASVPPNPASTSYQITPLTLTGCLAPKSVSKFLAIPATDARSLDQRCANASPAVRDICYQLAQQAKAMLAAGRIDGNLQVTVNDIGTYIELDALLESDQDAAQKLLEAINTRKPDVEPIEPDVAEEFVEILYSKAQKPKELSKWIDGNLELEAFCDIVLSPTVWPIADKNQALNYLRQQVKTLSKSDFAVMMDLEDKRPPASYQGEELGLQPTPDLLPLQPALLKAITPEHGFSRRQLCNLMQRIIRLDANQKSVFAISEDVIRKFGPVGEVPQYRSTFYPIKLIDGTQAYLAKDDYHKFMQDYKLNRFSAFFLKEATAKQMAWRMRAEFPFFNVQCAVVELRHSYDVRNNLRKAAKLGLIRDVLGKIAEAFGLSKKKLAELRVKYDHMYYAELIEKNIAGIELRSRLVAFSHTLSVFDTLNNEVVRYLEGK